VVTWFLETPKGQEQKNPLLTKILQIEHRANWAHEILKRRTPPLNRVRSYGR